MVLGLTISIENSVAKAELSQKGRPAKSPENSNEGSVDSVKNSNLKFGNSHTHLASRRSKRIMLRESQGESGERRVYFGDAKTTKEAKHTEGKEPTLNHFMCSSQSVTQTNCVFVDLDETELPRNKRREQKSNVKHQENALDKLSHTTLQIIKQVKSLKKDKLSSIEERDEEAYEKAQEDSTTFKKPREESKIQESKDTADQPTKCVRFQSPKKVNHKPSVANLSKKTLDILKKFKRPDPKEENKQWTCEKDKTELDYRVDRILDGPSMKEKYEELLGEGELKLVMPAHFKTLLKFQESCDDVIKFFRGRSRALKFEDISASVSTHIRRTFTQKHFCQILAAEPDLYTYEWKKTTGDRSYMLFIDIPANYLENSKLLNNRSKLLQDTLYKITAGYHHKFLKQLTTKRPALKDYLSDYEPFTQKAWYHEFDPHDERMAPKLKPIKLERQPNANNNRSESVADYLKRTASSQKRDSQNKVSFLSMSNTSIQKPAPNALASVTKSKNNTIQETPKQTPATPTINGIPSDLFARVKAREEVYTAEKKAAEEERATNKNIILKEHLNKLIDTLKSIYTVKRVNVLYLNKLLKELDDSQRGCFDERTDHYANIQHLHAASPQWLKIIQVPQGRIVKLKPDYKKPTVRADIERYIRELEQKEKDQTTN